MKKMIILLVCAMVVAACQQKETPEERANMFLALSRSSLAVNDFDKAKAYIDSIRSKCPTALNARESAIILLDSINIALSKVELQKMEEEMSKIVNPDKIAKDTLDFYHDEAKEKVRFFERKLQHDIQHKAVH
ncbi:MAG: hypothetical protein II122_00130 [Bacteroidaceae bacterium]|jgi:hypothetical protein|nr:hypothetical protein [Bacteroidaceae bacterium]